MRSMRIGLTGGIGSGKSIVSQRFEELGVPVIDTDVIARELVEPGLPAYDEILKVFTVSILDGQKRIDRVKLRKLVFVHPKYKMQLERILHPKIRDEVIVRTEKIDAPYCVVVVPLLVEAGFVDIFDRILVVDCSPELQAKRAAKRDGLSDADIRNIMKTQVDSQSRRAVADDIVENNGGIDELYRAVDSLHQRYMEMLKAPVQPIPSQSTTNNLKTVATENVIENNLYLGNESRSNEIPEPFKDGYIFEQPLNERLRTLLRLECLFNEVDYHLKGDNVWDTRAAMKAFINIMLVLGRPELKTEFMKEVDRLHTSLSRYVNVQGVDSSRLMSLSQELFNILRQLRAIEGQIGYSLKVNEFLATMRQRDSAPGGAMSCDVPLYEFWLGKDLLTRRNDIQNWLKEYDIIRSAVFLILKLVRESTRPQSELARNGHYQANLDTSIPYQMIRVFLPRATDAYPEISAGRHRFTIRFVRCVGFEKPTQIDGELPFLIACCAL